MPQVPGESTKRRAQNQDIAIDPALLETQESTATRTQYSRDAYGSNIGEPSHQIMQRPRRALPTSREDMRERRESRVSSRPDATNSFNSNMTSTQSFHQQPFQSSARYPDAGLIDRGGLRDRFLQSRAVPGSGIGPPVPRSQPEPTRFTQEDTNRSVTRSSRKRTRVDAGLSADAKDNLGDATPKSQRSTRRSKRTKTSSKENNTDDEGERKLRKTSKLNVKIAQGKGPKRGSLGPNGEIRIRGDQMEFRDVNNPKWTLAAYHNDYRRDFLDEAAEEGEFDFTPTRGEADDDETSYEPEQQSWGPSREDWQNIVNAEGEKVMFLVDKPKSRRPPQEPGNWIHDGRILLDLKNHPVKNWPGLNKTLSTEIESWRWEALMRKFPWLTVADLLARMPHTRKQYGRVMSLQTPQAFTNRAYRFRVPNQIPASNPKNGSDTYRQAIQKNLAKTRAETTEGLSTLSQSQINRVKKANEGKFKENSRYVVKDKNPPETQPPSEKRKAHFEDDTESDEETPKAKRPCIRTPEDLGAEVPSLNEMTRVSTHGDTRENPYSDGAGVYDGENRNEEEIVLLFASIGDRYLALVQDQSFANPYAVMQAQENGHLQARQFGVHWYRRSTPRYVGPDGILVEDVVHATRAYEIVPDEHVPGVFQPTP